MKYKKSKTKKSPVPRQKVAVIILVIIALIAVVSYWLHYQSTHDPKPTYTKTSTGYDVNLNPPTKQEQQQGNENKQEITKNEAQNGQTTTPPPSGTVTSDPFITYASQEGANVVLRGYVGGVFEDGGTCTATFTKGALKVTGSSTGFEDSNHVTCPPITISRSSFSEAGNWAVVLSYRSDKAANASQSRNVVIQ